MNKIRIKSTYLVLIIVGVFFVATLGFVFIPSLIKNNYVPPEEPPIDPPPPPPTSEIEVDAYGSVYYIVDGDTYDQNGEDQKQI